MPLPVQFSLKFDFFYSDGSIFQDLLICYTYEPPLFIPIPISRIWPILSIRILQLNFSDILLDSSVFSPLCQFNCFIQLYKIIIIKVQYLKLNYHRISIIIFSWFTRYTSYCFGSIHFGDDCRIYTNNNRLPLIRRCVTAYWVISIFPF